MKTIDLTEYQSKLFFTSDTHFNHFKIAEYCNRPFASREEMNKALIENWNNEVPRDGIVVHCGDFMLSHSQKNEKDYDKIANKLNGTIYLVRGNHDIISLREEDYKTGNHIVWVGDILNVQIDSQKIIASHYPLLCFPGQYNVFGHVHTLGDGKVHGPDSPFSDFLKTCEYRQYDVGVDQNGYKPIAWKEIAKKINVVR